jgi:hypothetical protein
VLGFLLTAVLSIGLDLERWVGWALIVALCGPGIWGSTYLKRSVRLVDFGDEWLRFKFRSVEYAEEFESLNFH